MYDPHSSFLFIVDILIIGCCLVTTFVLWRTRRRIGRMANRSTGSNRFRPHMETELWRQQADAALADIAIAVAEQRAKLTEALPAAAAVPNVLSAPIADVIPLAVQHPEPAEGIGLEPDRAETRLAQQLARRRKARRQSALA